MPRMNLVWTEDTGFAELAEKMLAAVDKLDFSRDEVFFAFLALRSTVIQLGFEIGETEQKPEAEVPGIPEAAEMGDTTSVLMRAVELTMSAVQIVQNQTDWLNQKHGETVASIQKINRDLDIIGNAVVELGGALPER